MATAYQAFNDLLGMFLKELKKGFPQHGPLLDKADDMLGMAIRANFKTPTNVFMQHAMPYVTRIMNRDETVLQDFDSTKLIPIEIAPLWREADENAKECIWQYLYSIAFMGAGISQLDDEMLNIVEAMADTIKRQTGL